MDWYIVHVHILQLLQDTFKKKKKKKNQLISGDGNAKLEFFFFFSLFVFIAFEILEVKTKPGTNMDFLRFACVLTW